MKKLFLLTSALCHLTSYISFSQGAWIQKANFAGPGRYLAAGFSIGSRGYIGTGWDGAANTQDLWEWNQTTDTWSQKANFPGTARFGATGFSIGTKGYIATGYDNSTLYQDFWEYDQATNVWTQRANFGGTARAYAVGFSIGTKGYIGTGYDAIGYTQDFWEWDMTTNTWIPKANFGGTGRDGAVGFSIGTKGYIGTGLDSVGFRKDFWEWDQVSNTWTQKANFGGTGIGGAVGFSIGTKGYIGTGWNGASNTQNFWEWDQAGNIWIQKASLGGTARNGAAYFSIGTKGYIGTGYDGSIYYNDFWEFDSQDTTLNILSGSVFTDVNANCVMDGGDVPLTNWFVQAKSSTSTSYGSAGTNGNYNIWVPSGTYSVSVILKPYWTQVCPASTYTALVATQDTVANLDFGAVISNYCPDLTVSIGASLLRRCMTNNYYVQYLNNGTTTAINPLLKINFDPKIIPLSSTIPWDSISGNSYFWKVDSVQPGQYFSFNLVDSISCNAQLGDTLYTSAQWLNVAGDCNFENNIDYDHHVVIGSFDPNAKEAYTSSNMVYIKQANILPSDTINYMIQFQNTGTDTAFTVTLYDTLDSDLDIPSIISGVSSHPYTFQLMGAGILKWTFNNILLPDSNINEPASHGFVKFQILQKPNNPNGTVIKNSAAIIFDFNAPVITDTVTLTVSTVGIQEVKGEDNTISIYPNPSTGIFTINFSDASDLRSQATLALSVTSIEIINVLGKEIYKSSVIGHQSSVVIDLRKQPKGIYFYKVTGRENETITGKIIIQ